MSVTGRDLPAPAWDSTSALLVTGAGLAGAAGVALGAAAAHRVDSPALVTASTILMIHAVAVLVLATLQGQQHGGSACGFHRAGIFMLAAVALFAGDIALHTLAGSHIFPYAAPIGGSSLILSWLTVAGLGIAGVFRRR